MIGVSEYGDETLPEGFRRRTEACPRSQWSACTEAHGGAARPIEAAAARRPGSRGSGCRGGDGPQAAIGEHADTRRNSVGKS